MSRMQRMPQLWLMLLLLWLTACQQQQVPEPVQPPKSEESKLSLSMQMSIPEGVEFVSSTEARSTHTIPLSGQSLFYTDRHADGTFSIESGKTIYFDVATYRSSIELPEKYRDNAEYMSDAYVPIHCLIYSYQRRKYAYRLLPFKREGRKLTLKDVDVVLSPEIDLNDRPNDQYGHPDRYFIIGWIGGSTLSVESSDYVGFYIEDGERNPELGYADYKNGLKANVVSFMFPWHEIDLTNNSDTHHGNVRDTALKMMGSFMRIVVPPDPTAEDGVTYAFPNYTSETRSFGFVSNMIATNGLYNMTGQPLEYAMPGPDTGVHFRTQYSSKLQYGINFQAWSPLYPSDSEVGFLRRLSCGTSWDPKQGLDRLLWFVPIFTEIFPKPYTRFTIVKTTADNPLGTELELENPIRTTRPETGKVYTVTLKIKH